MLAGKTVEKLIKLIDRKVLSYLYCRYTNLSIVEKLLETDKIIVDREGSDKMTPLHYAARSSINDATCPLTLLS